MLTTLLHSRVNLACETHNCPLRCHQLVDHSKMSCKRIVECTCPRKHCNSRPCDKITRFCSHCDSEDREIEQNRKRESDLAIDQDNNKKRYTQQLAEVQKELGRVKRERLAKSQEQKRRKFDRQHRDHIEYIKNLSKTLTPPLPKSRQQ